MPSQKGIAAVPSRPPNSARPRGSPDILFGVTSIAGVRPAGYLHVNGHVCTPPLSLSPRLNTVCAAPTSPIGSAQPSPSSATDCGASDCQTPALQTPSLGEHRVSFGEAGDTEIPTITSSAAPIVVSVGIGPHAGRARSAPTQLLPTAKPFEPLSVRQAAQAAQAAKACVAALTGLQREAIRLEFVDVYAPDTRVLFADVPVGHISHFGRSVHGRLLLCRPHSDWVAAEAAEEMTCAGPSTGLDRPAPAAKGCPSGEACQCAHIDVPLSRLNGNTIHVHYVYRSEECCAYDRVAPAGPSASIPVSVLGSGGEAPAEAYTFGLLLRTKGSELALADALADASRPITVRHCPHFYWSQTCYSGVSCTAVHVVSIDASQERDSSRPYSYGKRLQATAAIDRGQAPASVTGAPIPAGVQNREGYHDLLKKIAPPIGNWHLAVASSSGRSVATMSSSNAAATSPPPEPKQAEKLHVSDRPTPHPNPITTTSTITNTCRTAFERAPPLTVGAVPPLPISVAGVQHPPLANPLGLGGGACRVVVGACGQLAPPPSVRVGLPLAPVPARSTGRLSPSYCNGYASNAVADGCLAASAVRTVGVGGACRRCGERLPRRGLDEQQYAAVR